MAGISPWDSAVTEFEVWVVFRTRPIRVAGPSGPLPGETTWDALGLQPEYTTVTGNLRRVGAWDAERAAAAVRDNGGAPVVRLAFTMLDQAFPEVAGETLAIAAWALKWLP
jgi:adenylosuccinate synthase